jgi:hypothetical protein
VNKNLYAKLFIIQKVKIEYIMGVVSLFRNFVTSLCLVVSLSFNVFAADTTKPVLTEKIPIPAKTNDTTPSYTFSSTEAGTIIYWGNCISDTRTAVVGYNTVVLSDLIAGTYSTCSLSVKDIAGNISSALIISSFTIDLVKPVLTVVTPVPILSVDTTPSYTFNSTEAGTIIYGGACKSAKLSVFKGINTVTFNALVSGTYNNCTIKVIDKAGNISLTTIINSFTINAPDIIKPEIKLVTEVKPISNDKTPTYTFSSTEPGTIIYSGACISTQTVAIKGINSVTFNQLAAGTYSNCTIKLKDAAGNISLDLNVNTFTIELIKPVLTQITAIPATTTDTTPNYIFSSTEDGVIIYAGDCISINTSAYQGSNIVTFNELATNISHSNCTLKVKDAAGNVSSVLVVPTFKIIGALVPTKANPILNDTGITLCGDSGIGDSHQNNLVCTTVGAGISVSGIDSNGDAVPAGQDALYGRDANSATNSITDGEVGFSFTKLDSNGAALAANATSWSCVKDNVTGLIWEIKTDDGGLRDKDWKYSWYSTDTTNNGGTEGYADVADNCYVATRCDTQKFVVDVNASKLCGAANWRLPSMQELQTIVNNERNSPATDRINFPNTMSSLYWSFSPYAYLNDYAWIVHFNHGDVTISQKSNSNYIRLVRSGQ